MSLQVIKVPERTKHLFSKTKAFRHLYKNKSKNTFPHFFAVILGTSMKHSVSFRVGKVEMHGLHALGTKYFFISPSVLLLFRNYRFICREKVCRLLSGQV